MTNSHHYIDRYFTHGSKSKETIVHARHTEIAVVDQTFYLTRSQYTDTRPTNSSADIITSDTRQGSHWCAKVSVSGIAQPG